MRKKGYISIFTLLVSLLLFSLITVILIGADMDNTVNANKKDYYQNCLISESVLNTLQFNKKESENIKSILESFPEKQNIKIKLEDINIIKDVELKITEKGKDFLLSYNIKYKDTKTDSIILFTKKENILLENIEIINKNDVENFNSIILEDYLNTVDGEIVIFAENDEILYLEEKFYNKIIEEKEKEENLDYIFQKYGKEIKKDDIYYFNPKSIKILGKQELNISGIFTNNGNITGENNINLNGVLINKDKECKNINVKGKIIEEENFNGNVVFNKEIIEKILKRINIKEEYEIKEYFIF